MEAQYRGRLPAARAFSFVAAFGLVAASCGFNAAWAFQSNAIHGPLLGTLAVGFAVSLDIAKTLAFAGAAKALSGWRIPRAVTLGLLASVAVLYSLSAEIGLLAQNRAQQIVIQFVI